MVVDVLCTILYFADRYTVDLGAQYVYPESVGCIYDFEWPDILMEEENPVVEFFVTYDSSGLRILDESGRDIDIFMQEQNFKIPADWDLETSVGEYIEIA